jgi:hypothetical protein
MEVGGHDTLSRDKLVVVQRKLVDLSVQIFLLDFSELLSTLCKQQVDIKRESEQAVRSDGALSQGVQENGHFYVLLIHQHHRVVIQFHFDAFHVVFFDPLEVALLLVLWDKIGESRGLDRNLVAPQ